MAVFRGLLRLKTSVHCGFDWRQDLLAKAFDAFLEEGDSILVEAPTYR